MAPVINNLDPNGTPINLFSEFRYITDNSERETFVRNNWQKIFEKVNSLILEKNISVSIPELNIDLLCLGNFKEWISVVNLVISLYSKLQRDVLLEALCALNEPSRDRITALIE